MVILLTYILIKVVTHVLASCITILSSTVVLCSGLSLLPAVVGVSSRAFYILMLAALMKAPST
jgi:hypothetical protein